MKKIFSILCAFVLCCIGLLAFSFVKPKAATIYEEYEIGKIELNEEDLFYNFYFGINNYGDTSKIYTASNIPFWKDLIVKLNEDFYGYVPVDVAFSVDLEYKSRIYVYEIGFQYVRVMGGYQIYINDDIAVMKGLQLCDALTGLKTYIPLKEEEIKSFKIVSIGFKCNMENVIDNTDMLFYRGYEYLTIENGKTIDDLLPYYRILYDFIINERRFKAIKCEDSSKYYNAGYEKGEDVGYNKGYNNGYDDCGAVANLPDIIPDTIDTIWEKVFVPILDFEILGLSVSNIVYIIMSFAFLALVIKLII